MTRRVADDRERFPTVREDLGEDPARFLDRPLLEPGSEGAGGALLVEARIRGIDDHATLSAWKAIERRLGRGPGAGPRRKVMEMLRRREEALNARGDLEDRLEHLDDRPERDTDSIVVRYDPETGDPYRLAGGGLKGTRREFLEEDPLADPDDVEHQETQPADPPSAVATDGGEDS